MDAHIQSPITETAVMSSGRLRLSVAQARELAEGALCGIGYARDEARIVADHVIDAALCGYEYSGLAKILNVPESEHFRLPRRPMTVLRETDVSLAFDGGNNLGMIALFQAAQATIKKATSHGLALVSVTDAWMSGRSAYYVEMIARHGLIVIHTAASSRLVAPPGGIRPLLGTNPIAIGVPSSRGPIVLDMGTSAYMMTEVLLRERLGEALPEGVAIGPDGEPTRDPALARRGALLPFGGYKGFGLALMLQALGVLAGCGAQTESDYGYLFVAFRPGLVGPAEIFEQRVTQLVDNIKATPRQAGVHEIRIPSERAFRARERAVSEGLEIDQLVFDGLCALRARSAPGPTDLPA
jgi:LDH2 family malate/lactate/ureidoglycolate dehydrogenase